MSSSSPPSKPAEVSHLPYFAEGCVVSGFGRGSKELGIPTANFPEYVVRALPDSFACGVYYGWARLSSSDTIYKMSLCVGWNPYYHNTVKTMETHILHTFPDDFYGEHLKVIIVGFLRPMCDFSSLDALITAIHNDNKSASERLDILENLAYRSHPFFSSPPPTHTGESGESAGQGLNSTNQKTVNGDHTAPDSCGCDCTQSVKNDSHSINTIGAVDSKLCNGVGDSVDCECKDEIKDGDSSSCRLSSSQTPQDECGLSRRRDRAGSQSKL